jgi:hypothetical protein
MVWRKPFLGERYIVIVVDSDGNVDMHRGSDLKLAKKVAKMRIEEGAHLVYITKTIDVFSIWD